jgi:radical SAM protein with 4Fe4S-binding SPASM domain
MKVHKWMEEIKLVSGYNRSVLYDLNRQDFHFIPNDLHELIDKIEGEVLPDLSINELEWYNKLIHEEFFFMVSKKMFYHFKPLSLNWEHPSFIINTIIYDSEHLEKAIQLIDGLICKYLLIITESIDRVEEILDLHFSVSNFLNVDFFVNEAFDLEKLDYLKEKHPVLGSINQSGLNDNREPRIVNINSRYFLEAQKFNTFFNRKICIDNNGNLKNAPDCHEIIDNIENIDSLEKLKNLISNPTFQKYWHVNRDSISVCKDCELRYMCFDSRLPKQRSENEWYFETECDYNPYISKWKGDIGFLSLSDCGVINNADGFFVNNEQITKINAEIWGE